eukprot:6545519-Pyramimonas_sp.AAC.1
MASVFWCGSSSLYTPGERGPVAVVGAGPRPFGRPKIALARAQPGQLRAMQTWLWAASPGRGGHRAIRSPV